MPNTQDGGTGWNIQDAVQDGGPYARTGCRTYAMRMQIMTSHDGT